MSSRIIRVVGLSADGMARGFRRLLNAINRILSESDAGFQVDPPKLIATPRIQRLSYEVVPTFAGQLGRPELWCNSEKSVMRPRSWSNTTRCSV